MPFIPDLRKSRTYFFAVFCLFFGNRFAVAASEPHLYIIFDSSASMNHSQPVIADMLDIISSNLAANNTITQDVRFFSFRDELIDDETKSLSYISQVLAKTILIDSTENILPVLESMASTPELNDAIVFVFSDGRNAALSSADTDELMTNLASRLSQFHMFIPFPIWCGREHIFAVNADLSMLGDEGSIIECEKLSNVKNQAFGNQVELDKLSSLAFETGGLVWPIDNFAQVGKGTKNAPANLVNVAAQKLSTILLEKGEKSLSASVNYSRTVSVGETVYFEVLGNSSIAGVGEPTSWRWDFNSDGEFDDAGTFISRAFTESGEFIISLELTNNDTPSVTRTLQLPITVLE